MGRENRTRGQVRAVLAGGNASFPAQAESCATVRIDLVLLGCSLVGTAWGCFSLLAAVIDAGVNVCEQGPLEPPPSVLPGAYPPVGSLDHLLVVYLIFQGAT